MTGYRAISLAALTRSAAARAVGFGIIWIILSGGGPVDLLPGLVAVPAATAISLGLLPPGERRVQPLVLTRYGLRLLRQSLIAGTDVARRALDPRLPLDPGCVGYRTGIPPGSMRNTFTTLMSLLPGTIPVGADDSGALSIHCLNRRQPVAVQLAAEEAWLVRTTGAMPGDG